MASEPRYMKLPELFSGRLYRVPDYQRGYAWTARQLEDLWSDIELLDDKTQHFTGMIVVEGRGERENEREMRTYRVLEVIDGQQRLTTLVLLLQALSDSLSALPFDDAEEQAALLRKTYVGAPGWRRIALNDDSRVYFEKVLDDGEPPAHFENASQKNIHDAVQFFKARLLEFSGDADARYSAIAQLVRRLQSNLRFVTYEVDDDAEAGLIFEVMNNRGKPLSEADRLKNYVMYLAHKVGLPDEAVKTIANRWGHVFKQVMRASQDGEPSHENEDRLLRNHWVLYKEISTPREFRGLSFSQRVRKDIALPPASGTQLQERNERVGEAALDYTQSLQICADDMADISVADRPGALSWIEDEAIRRDARRLLLSFQRMDHVAAALPLLLAARRRIASRPTDFLRVVKLLSTFCFRAYALCGRRSNAGQSQLRGLAKRLFDAPVQRVVTETQAIVDGLVWGIERYAPDREVLAALKAPDFYTSLRGQETRYFFYEYEIHQCHGQDPALDWTTFANTRNTQIEHVWPQAREGYLLGDDQAIHDANVNRLGNLTISHFNQKLSNRKFEDKKPIYARSNLIIENSLQHLSSWGLSEIADREERLIDFAMNRWGV